MSDELVIRKWAMAYTWKGGPPGDTGLLARMAEDEVFGRPVTSKWHLSRGMKREVASGDPRFHFDMYYGVFMGLKCDDPAIGERFERILREWAV